MNNPNNIAIPAKCANLWFSILFLPSFDYIDKNIPSNLKTI